jgi:hypothetical protein
LWRTSKPALNVWLPRILVNVEATLYVFSERSQGRLGEKPRNGFAAPTFTSSKRVSPLVKSSMFAPAIPTSLEVLRPAPWAVATLW